MTPAADRMEFMTLVAGPLEAGLRLDQFVAAAVEGCSRNTAATWIKSGQVRVMDTMKKPGYRICPGDIISTPCRKSSPAPDFVPQAVALDPLFVDEHLLVINKPPGLVVHPGAGHFTGTLAHGLAWHFPEIRNVGSDPDRPGIVHRLDKDTSGLILAARTENAWQSLIGQFKARCIKKTYAAFVYGRPKQKEGQIRLAVYRHPKDRKKMAAGDHPPASARCARTDWQVLQDYPGPDVSLLECRIQTGRTHQIRVHLSAIGHPVVGDPTYGCRHAQRALRQNPKLKKLLEPISRQMLHAWKIGFTHPETGEKMCFTAPLPPDMAELQLWLDRFFTASVHR